MDKQTLWHGSGWAVGTEKKKQISITNKQSSTVHKSELARMAIVKLLY